MKPNNERLSNVKQNTERTSSSFMRIFLGVIQSKEIIYQLVYRDLTVQITFKSA